MKAIIAIGGLCFMGVAGWQLGGRLSSDAIGMALGVLFGIMAGIPASLMVLAARRRDFGADEFEPPRRGRQQQQPQFPMGYGQFPQQPPVIVVAGQGMTGQGMAGGQQGGYPQHGFAQNAYTQNGYPQRGYGMPHPSDMPPGQMMIEGPVSSPQQREFRVVGEVEEVLEPWQ